MQARTTGEVAQLFSLAEAQLNDILRRAFTVRPPVVRGKRRWRAEDVVALAMHLGRPVPASTHGEESA